MKIFVTGSTGFIGSHVINQALKAGHHILAHRRLPSRQASIKLHMQPKWLDKPLLYIKACDLSQIDVIIHLAAIGVSPRSASWEELKTVNIDSTMHMCFLAKAINSSIVIAGSYAEYGLSALRYEHIPVTAALEPTFPYAASKAASSVLAVSYARSANISLSYLRIFNAFGEGQHFANLWPSMRKAAQTGLDFPMTAGEQVRDFISVENVAKSFVQEAELISQGNHRVNVRNIGSGRPQTIRSFSEFWWNHWNASGKLLIGALPYREGEVMRYVPSL